MASLFSQPQQIKGGFRADQVSISISGIVTGMLITRVGINFEQPINMVYALENTGAAANGAAAGVNNTGGNNVYMVAGRPSGSAQIERVVGPTPINAPWLTQFGNACNVVNNDMTFAAAAGNCLVGGATSSTGQYTLKGCVITRFGLNVQSEQAMIQNSLDLRFADLIIPDA
jgi:hypothetical protein